MFLCVFVYGGVLISVHDNVLNSGGAFCFACHLFWTPVCTFRSFRSMFGASIDLSIGRGCCADGR